MMAINTVRKTTGTVDIHGDEIAIGDIVRSFDFESRDITGENACYYLGQVVGITREADCKRYVIQAFTQVFEGRVESADCKIYPPLNGTPKMFGGVVDCVEIVASAAVVE